MRALLPLLVVSLSTMVLAEIPPAADAPQPLSPAESAAKIRLPEGFRIELVASEPLIQDPSGVAFDERGRLFVCELHGYNVEGHLDVLELNKTGVLDRQVRRLRWELMGGKIAAEAREFQYGVVKLLTDSDGDGVMDRAQVWADDLEPCYGLVAARGGIIVVAAPDIVYLADRNGDGEVDIRKTLFTGFATSVLERGINNPTWGLDNWLYVGSGRHAATIRGQHLAKPVTLGNQDFRIRTDGTAIEPVSGNVRTFGLALNDVGDRFPCTGGQPAMYALPLPFRYLSRNPHVPSPEANHFAADYSRGFRISEPHPWRVKRGEDPAWVKFYGARETNSIYFSGGCGGQIYRADLFPPEYRSNFLYCEPSLNIVHRCVIERDGAGYKAYRAPGEEESEFLASTDQWFRPMNLRVGPDGALYIVDMYREIVEDYSAIPRFLQQQYGLVNGSDRGRIWRLLPETGAKRDFADLTRWSADQLVRATGDRNAWWRHTAQRLLVERGERSAAPQLSAQIRSGVTPQSRLHALYTLEGLDELQLPDVRSALNDSDYGVRMHALRLAERWLRVDRRLLPKVVAMTDDPDPRVRLQVAMTLGESSDALATTALLTLARRYGDERWMAAAILSSVTDSADEVLSGLLAKRTPIQGAASLLKPLAETLAGRRDLTQVASVLSVLPPRPPAEKLATLEGLVAGFSRGLAAVPERNDVWPPLKQLLQSDSPEIRSLATQLAARMGHAGRPELREVFDGAAERALDIKLPVDERLSAIRLLAYAPFDVLADPATQLVDARQPLGLQQAAVEALDESDDERIGAALLTGWSGLTPIVRRQVLGAILARENRLPALLNALESERVRRQELNATQREQLMKSRSEEIARRAERLLKGSKAEGELQGRIDRYQKALASPRDAKRGKEVFAKTCMACHKLGDEGHDVGPPLGSVSNKPDESILMDILDPSGHIESEYVSYLVVTVNGLTLMGIPVSESATSLTLQKEKGVKETILRSDIELLKASEVSLMPENLYEQISPQDAASLIAFLRQAFRSKP